MARAAWASLCEDLETAGNLAKTDAKLIEIYAETYALWRRCVSLLTLQELATEDLEVEAGGVKATTRPDRRFVNPLCGLYLNLSARLRQLLLDCGLAPSARKPGDGRDDSPFAALIDLGHGQL